MNGGFLVQNTLEIFGQLFLSVLLGALIGLERELARKKAGMRTFSLVALGSCLFSIISKFAFREFWGLPGFDPSRIASQVVVGIGFIGAGVILFDKTNVKGLTTAAGLWVSAGIGMAIGYRLYAIGIFAAALTIVVLVLLWMFEFGVIRKHIIKNAQEQDFSD